MKGKIPILLSFHGIGNERATMVSGQLTYTPIKDFSFSEYSKRKTFRTLFRMYRTRPYANQEIRLIFDKGYINTKTNSYGGFYEIRPVGMEGAMLRNVVLNTGEEVNVLDGMYPTGIQPIQSSTIVVSDIDDTLLHSYIYRKLKKLRTLMFTRMEKRMAVGHMHDIIQKFTNRGASVIYLSNSEQNLYPMIYRIMRHNNFPAGPLFLKSMRSIWDLVRNVKFPPKNTHKIATLEDLLKVFPDKKFVLIGDNTQHDLEIYLTIAEKFPENIDYIIIRKVVEREKDVQRIEAVSEKLRKNNIEIFYSDLFPALPGL